jgi:hypothetical protein
MVKPRRSIQPPQAGVILDQPLGSRNLGHSQTQLGFQYREHAGRSDCDVTNTTLNWVRNLEIKIETKMDNHGFSCF